MDLLISDSNFTLNQYNNKKIMVLPDGTVNIKQMSKHYDVNSCSKIHSYEYHFEFYLGL